MFSESPRNCVAASERSSFAPGMNDEYENEIYLELDCETMSASQVALLCKVVAGGLFQAEPADVMRASYAASACAIFATHAN